MTTNNHSLVTLCSERRRLLVGSMIGLLLASGESPAQQFNGDNQWVAPYGVSTLVATVGQEYAQAYAVAALVPEWEFNLQVTHYYDDPEEDTESYTAANLFVKHRLKENAAETSGYAFIVGTGLNPDYIDSGEKVRAFEAWYAMGIATYAFADNTVLLDILPGVLVNTEQAPDDDTAWGMTYSSRVAVYDVIPESAIVAEVFGTTGEAFAEPSYRFGVRWESPKLIAAVTYSDAFDGSYGAGFEIGFIYLTEPRLCWGGCR